VSSGTVRKISTRQCAVSKDIIIQAVIHPRSSQRHNFMDMMYIIFKSTDDIQSPYQVWQLIGFKVGKKAK